MLILKDDGTLLSKQEASPETMKSSLIGETIGILTSLTMMFSWRHPIDEELGDIVLSLC